MNIQWLMPADYLLLLVFIPYLFHLTLATNEKQTKKILPR